MRTMKETDLAMLVNDRTYIDYFDRLKLLAISLFTWDGLDDVAGYGASRFLETTLFEKGRACFLKDEKLGYLALNANPSDKLNTYNLPERVDAWSIAYHKEWKFDDVVYIMNNELEIPTYNTLSLFSYRLYDAQRTIDTNLIAQKTPVLIEGDTKTILTLKNVYMQYSGNTPFIFGNKQFDISNKLNVLKTDAPYLIDKLTLYKHELWNECLTYMGINNANIDKKERLITDEIESNDDLIKYYLNCFYKTRKQACDKINEKYFDGEEVISVKLNEETLKLLKINERYDIDYQNEMEDSDYEQIYSND